MNNPPLTFDFLGFEINFYVLYKIGMIFYLATIVQFSIRLNQSSQVEPKFLEIQIQYSKELLFWKKADIKLWFFLTTTIITYIYFLFFGFISLVTIFIQLTPWYKYDNNIYVNHNLILLLHTTFGIVYMIKSLELSPKIKAKL
ncbi:MAG: hypothetical protein FGM41_04310 [Bacteroidetes bacterium]|nr:hypothetical protein [Bacteroidota bacterium]